jgi:F420H(2)-dependent quinone reductase
MTRHLRDDHQPQELERVPSGKSAVERIHPPRWLIRHLVNPIARPLLKRAKGRIGSELLLLRFVGRRTGRRYEIPVGYRSIGGRLALFTNSGWRHNFQGSAPVEITLRGKCRGGRATLLVTPTGSQVSTQRLSMRLALSTHKPSRHQDQCRGETHGRRSRGDDRTHGSFDRLAGFCGVRLSRALSLMDLPGRYG